VAPYIPAYLSIARGLFPAGLFDIGALRQRLGEIRADQNLGRGGTGQVSLRLWWPALLYD